MDTEDNGFATGLSTCLLKDGTQNPTANLPMNGFAHTGVGNATLANQYAVVSQIQNSSFNWVAGGGTADAITATYSPAVTALTDGMELDCRATAANATTTPTFSPNGITAHTITKKGGTALVAGDIPAALAEFKLRYNLANTRWELINPASSVSNPFSDASALVKNSGDATKLVIFSAASVTTGTTRTLTAQDKSYTIADNADLASLVKTVKDKVFSSSGTYTPSTGMLYCIVEAVDGGGGGGGVKSSSAGAGSVANGGYSGAYGRATLTAAQIGASKTVTIGAAGTAGSNAGGNGGAGGTTSLGTLLVGAASTPGGTGSTNATLTQSTSAPSAGSLFATADFSTPQQAYFAGGVSIVNTGGIALQSKGGNGKWGDGGPAIMVFAVGATAGIVGAGYGAGGSGAISNNTTTGAAGGAGAPGYMIITEFCSQ